MKKLVWVALVAMMTLTGNYTKAQTVGCNDTVHWGTPLSFEGNKCCWTVLEGPTDCFYANYNQIDCNYDTLGDHRFLSPWVEIPTFAATDSVVLIYATQVTCTAEYSVAITTDGVTYDTLRHRLVNEYQHDTIMLGAYAGQVIRIQLCHYGLNSTFDPYAGGCSYAADYHWQLLFSALQWRSLVYPVATCNIPNMAYVGETTWLQASLTEGSHNGLTYTWHSSLMGQTWTGDSVPVVYNVGGVDTITLVASNAYGSDTLVQTLTVIDCPGVITAHPWKVDFANDFDCWRTVGSVGWTSASRTVSGVTTYGISSPHNASGANIITSPAVALPADSTGLRLYWKDYRLSSSTSTYYVLVSTSDRFDISTYDTIFTCTSQTNNYTQRSVSLADYAGDTVYIAFCKMLQSGRNIYITDVQMYNTQAPLGVLYANDFAIVGDTTNFTVDLSQGDTLGLTVTLHSALKDSSWVMSANAWIVGSYWLDLVYDTPGEETVTVTATNAQGTLVLSANLNVFACNTVSTFPWEEDFSDAAGSYNACWTINGYSHNAPNSGYSAHDEETDVVWSMTNFMRATYAGSYMIMPPIAIPAGETNLAFMVEYAKGTMDIRVSPTASTDIEQFTDVLFTEPTSNYIKRRWVSLGAYAGQTIRVALVTTNPNSQNVNRVWVGLDTLPYIGLKASVPAKVHADSTGLCTISLSHGSTDGLHYTWSSKVGGIITTNALGDSAWISYSAGFSSTEDTITVVATNAYGADTVAKPLHIIDCSPALTLPWKETFADGDVCWYIPEGSNWHDAIPNNNASQEHLRHLFSHCTSDTIDSWIMSKAITIPADTTEAVHLFWKAASSRNNFMHTYRVLVTTSESFTDTSVYQLVYFDSSTHVNFSNYDSRSVSLEQYAGQTIHIAFNNRPVNYAGTNTGLYIDDVEIRSSKVPVVSLSAPSATNSHTPVTFTATLIEGSSMGLTYTWHSTLMDSTMVTTAPMLTMAYTLGGTDTMMVIASNAYGADTATATVSVTDCTPIATLPWEEDFNNVAAVAYNAANGKVPNCWNRYWNGSDAKFTPHVISSYPYNPISGYVSSSNRALLLQAGTTAGYDSVAMVESPAFDVPLNGQLLSFYYMHESASYGTLSVGYLQDGAFVGVADMEPQAAGRTDTVSLQAIPAGVNRFALQWKKTGTWYGVIVDNIQVFAPDTLPTVRIEAPTQIFVGDPTTFRAILTNGLTDGLSFTWHSTLTGATYNSPASYFNIVYTAEGVDTVTVTAANAYGADSATVVVTVGSHPLPQVTVTGSSSLMAYDNTATFTATINDCSRNGLTCTWHSTLMDSTWVTPVQPSSTSTWQLVYTQGGLDTITCTVSNAYGTVADTTWCNVTNCYAFDVPYNEGFEMFNAGYTLPTCWQRIWNGTAAANYGPCILASGAYPFASHGSKVLMMKAGSSNNNYDTVAYAVLPQFEDSLTDLTLTFWYGHESVNRGTLTVGYLADSLFTPIADMTAVGIAGRRDTVSFSGVTADGARMALRWRNNLSVYAVAIDSLSVFVDNSFHAPRNLRVDSIGAQCVTLAWTPVENATAYHVTVDGAVDTVVSGAIATVCGLGPNTQCSASVAAISGSDTSSATTVAFTTLCHIVELPWFEDFQGSSPLACWSYTGAGYYYSMQICTEYYWEDYCHSGSRGLQMYNYTDGNTLVVSTPAIEAPADELLVSFWVCNPNEEGGLLEAGVITDPTDSTTFVPLMQCTMTDTPTRYEFDTRNVTVSGFAALAFRTTAYCTAMIVDDINVEQISTCARLRSVGSYALDARTAVVEWQYDTASAVPNTGVLITLTDLSDNTAAPVVVTATGNSRGFTGLAVGHRYQATVQALCNNDTTEALTTIIVPTGNVCAERNGDNTSSYTSYWYLDNVNRPYAYSQALYPATLAATVDTLYGIAYYLVSSAVEQYPSSYNTYSSGPRIVDVYIGQTSANSLTSPVSATNMTLAVQNYELSLTQTGWVRINFTNPLPLDGVSNLIVTLDDNTGAVYGDAHFKYHTDVMGNCFYTSSSSYSYTQTYDPYNPTSFNPNSVTWIPDIQLLGGCSNNNCLQPLVTVTAEDTHSVSLAWQQRGTEALWQVEYCEDGDSNWVIAGTTTDTTYILSLNASMAYRVRVASLCSGEAIYSDVHVVHTLCGPVSLPYYQTFRNYDMPNNVSYLTDATPCWETCGIHLLSQGRGLWNTHQNGDYIISPEIGANLTEVHVSLVANGSTFFLAGLKVGACDASGNNLQWIDTITLADSATEYTVYLNNYTGSERHIAIGGSYESWYLFDVSVDAISSCMPVHHVSLGQIDDTSVTVHWPPVDMSSHWAVYVDGSLAGITYDTMFAVGNFAPSTQHTIGVSEICSAGDTSVATTIDITTLCTMALPWTEDFTGGVDNELPNCWYPIFRPHTGSYLNAYILRANNNPYLYFYDYYSPYHEIDNDTVANFLCSPVIHAGSRAVNISFSGRRGSSDGVVQAGIMTNPADTNSFVPMLTFLSYTSTASVYQFTTDSLVLPDKYCLAFRAWGPATFAVDDINVSFVPLPTYTLTLGVNDTAMGSVSGDGTYEEGSVVLITAMPNDGYHFVTWNDSVTSATREVVVRGDIALTAFFAPDSTPVIPDTVWRTVTVTANVDGACETYGSGNYADSSVVEIGYTVVDTTSEGGHWQFLGWNDGGTGNPRDILVTSDTVIVALFEWIEDSVGIRDVQNYKIRIYPNPVHGDVTVSVSQPATVTVLDMVGREVISPTPIVDMLRLPTSDLPAGIYFVQIGTVVKKLVIR
jgi:hypothetical protein